MRTDKRTSDQLRPVKITDHYLMSPQGSVLIEMGNTKVICTATVEEATAVASSTVAVHMTLVFPISMSTDPCGLIR